MERTQIKRVNQYPSNIYILLINKLFSLDAFLFGGVSGMMLNMVSRAASYEPLCASRFFNTYRVNLFVIYRTF